MVYRETDDDWFQLTQSLAGAPRSTYEALARDLARRDPCGSDARLARLANGSLALVIAEREGRTAAQVIIRWHLQHGFVVIPKSVNPERIRSNAQVAGFTLGDADMAALDALAQG